MNTFLWEFEVFISKGGCAVTQSFEYTYLLYFFLMSFYFVQVVSLRVDEEKYHKFLSYNFLTLDVVWLR